MARLTAQVAEVTAADDGHRRWGVLSTLAAAVKLA
jgi:hypothetical protein